jgi:hypothetical protein
MRRAVSSMAQPFNQSRIAANIRYPRVGGAQGVGA